jgi:hypothetical protein
MVVLDFNLMEVEEVSLTTLVFPAMTLGMGPGTISLIRSTERPIHSIYMLMGYMKKLKTFQLLPEPFPTPVVF